MVLRVLLSSSMVSFLLPVQNAESYLIVGSAKSSCRLFVIQDLNFEGKVLLDVFGYEHNKRKLYAEGAVEWFRTSDIRIG